VTIVVLVGSDRIGSFNQHLARAAVAHLPEGADARIWQGLGELPFYSQDLDGATPPAHVQALRDSVAAADAVLVVTPEYNGSISAVVKNAIDWLSRPRGAAALAGKRAAVIAATGSPRGAQWAREHAVRVLTVAGAHVVAETVGVPSAHEALADGRLVDAELDAALAALMGQLVATEPAAA
jgi:NAD(P)H-dependent FMN reductase